MDSPLEPPPRPRPGWPTEDVYVYLRHPANDRPFLRLFRSDVSPSSSSSSSSSSSDSDPEPAYGIHHETLLTAASILACNEPGYLSTSRLLDPSSRVEDPPDAVLLGRVYYFHLLPPHPQDPSYLYPLCRRFRDWRFPHGALPRSWCRERPRKEDMRRWVRGEEIKMLISDDRDKACVVCKWKDGRSVAQLVPGERWLQNNQMEPYLSDPIVPYHLDPRNLITLRGDLRILFNQGYFVFLPKNSTSTAGDFRVHFLRETGDAGVRFHDVGVIDAVAVLSTELMYARFAWAVMSIMDELLAVDFFRFVQVGEHGSGGDGHEDRGRKRKGDKKPETRKHKAPRLDRDGGDSMRQMGDEGAGA